MTKHLFIAFLFAAFTGIAQNWSDVTSPVTNDLNDVYFVDDNNGWIVGRQGKILRTSDGGSNWSEQNSGTTKDLVKVHMVDNNTGFAVGDGGTFIKYNGTSWSAISIGFSQDMCGVFFLDANTGWISGDWGRIMMTTNGGSSWTNQVTNAQFSNKFNDLYMLSSGEGWAVGTSGRVLKYNGTNWSNVSNPASADLKDVYAVSFSDPSNGFMTGKNSTVYSGDGSNWSTHSTALPDNSFHVYDVKVVNASLAYAATTPGLGGQGIILKYNGSTWAKDYEYTGMGSELFYGVAVTPGGNVFAVGAGGMIKAKKSETGPVSGIAESSALAPIVFPNPSSVGFSILVNDAGASVRVFDGNGRMVLSRATENSDNNRIQIHAGELSHGVYTCRIESAGNVYTEKLVLLKQ